MENLRQQWHELMEITGVPWIVYISLLIVMVLVAVYVVRLFKAMATGEFGFSREEDFDVIREIHSRGMIADEEFDRAKTVLIDKTDEDVLKDVKSVDDEKK